MASALQGLSSYDINSMPNGENFRFGIVVSDWNNEITFKLLEACVETLEKHGTNHENIIIEHVPGSFELPYAAKLLLESDEPFDAVIILGAVITGETKHDEYICNAVSEATMRLGLDYEAPVIFGLLTPRNMQQAIDRAGGKHGNKGVEAAVTALKMAALNKKYL